MSKLLLLSEIIMMVAIPVASAADRDYRRGLRRALLLTFAFWQLVIAHERKKARRKTLELEAQAKALEATVT